MTIQPFKLVPNTPVALVLDFDGTITELDVVDALLVGFAQGTAWIEAEKAWARGAISSAECLRKQLGSVRIGSKEISEFLKTIPPDPSFAALRKYAGKMRVPLLVLSDGFDILIRKFFNLQGIRGVPFRSNTLRHSGERFRPSFPHKERSCGKCAHCKGATLAEIRPLVRHIVFVGDGLSDACAVRSADTVFAKGKLAAFCEKSEAPFRRYDDLGDVLDQLPELLRRFKKRVPAHEKIARS